MAHSTEFLHTAAPNPVDCCPHLPTALYTVKRVTIAGTGDCRASMDACCYEEILVRRAQDALSSSENFQKLPRHSTRAPKSALARTLQTMLNVAGMEVPHRFRALLPRN